MDANMNAALLARDYKTARDAFVLFHANNRSGSTLFYAKN